MFKFDTIVDFNVTVAKTFTGMIVDEKVRDQANKIVDTQAEFAKTAIKTSEDFVKASTSLFTK